LAERPPDPSKDASFGGGERPGFGRRGLDERIEEAYGEHQPVHWGKVALVFIGFAILYFATAGFFEISDRTIKKTVFSNQLVGPIETNKNDTVVEIKIETHPGNNMWSYIETEVYDAKKRTITTFGSDFYHESGYDSDGAWTESETGGNVTVVLPEPGKYFLRFQGQGGRSNRAGAYDLKDGAKLRVTVNYKKGGSTLLFYLGILLLIIGVILNEIRNQTIIGIINSFDDGD